MFACLFVCSYFQLIILNCCYDKRKNIKYKKSIYWEMNHIYLNSTILYNLYKTWHKNIVLFFLLMLVVLMLLLFTSSSDRNYILQDKCEYMSRPKKKKKCVCVCVYVRDICIWVNGKRYVTGCFVNWSLTLFLFFNVGIWMKQNERQINHRYT